MVNYKKYKNPPITEAVFDIRVKFAEDFSSLKFESLYEKLKEQFPTKNERRTWRTDFKFNIEGGAEIIENQNKGIDGYIYKSIDTKRLVQARVDGFTFNMLKPYEGWDSFYGQGKNLWNKYIEICKPEKITRLALRYINNIAIPKNSEELSYYFYTMPQLSAQIQTDLTSYLMRVVVTDPKNRLTAIVTQNLEKIPSNSDCIPIIFDIDVFKECDLTPQDGKIWNIMEQLHSFRTELFFKSITDATDKILERAN